MVVTVQRGLIRPSYSQGFTQELSKSDRPQDWLGLAAFYPTSLGPTGATLRDWSGFGNHGTLTNMVPASDWVIDGEQGHVLDYAGDDDRVIITDADVLDFTTAMSVSAWVRARTAGLRTGLVHKAVTPWVLRWESDDTARFIVSADGVSFKTAAGTTTLVTNRWYHIVGTFNGVIVSIYVDGVLEDTTPAAITLEVTTGNVTIGDDPGGANREFDGQIGQVRLYNRALTDREIWEQYMDSLGIVRLKQRIFGKVPAAAAGLPVGSLPLLGVGI